MHLFRINEVLNAIDELDGKTVQLEGLLDSTEGLGGFTSLQHWPKAEQQSPAGYFRAGIEIEPEMPVFNFNGDILAKWLGKRVVVLGTLLKHPLIDSTMDWSSHLPIPTPVLIKVRRIDLLKRWNREHAAE